jgi:SAM-dependent methyltransferase
MNEPIFITSPINVLHGDAAQVALKTTNDAAYYEAGKGVLQVPLERWQQAQQYERETWLTYGLSTTEDRNTEHAECFGGYAALPAKLGKVIELGCGAFTNLRHILPGREAISITLLDPLADAYQANHPHCTYINGKLNGQYVRVIQGTIEGYDTRDKFNTIVMVNVLSHCRDVESVFGWIKSHIKKGGHLVFSEPVRDIDPEQHFDVGHPLSYNQGVIDGFLKDFTPVHQNGAYFIGVRK